MTSALPSRRDEDWKHSDLRAALDGVAAPLSGEGNIIERLARAAGAFSARELADGDRDIVVDEIETTSFAPQAECVSVGAGGVYHRIVLQRGEGVALSSCRVRLGAGAVFRQFVIAEGARLARLETHVAVEGEDAEVELGGVYLCGADRHADLTSVVSHGAARGRTRQLVKGAARKGGRGVFQGKIIVEHAAQRTDARQHHKGMLLEDGAEIFAKPELMIFADDVACAHGNAAGGVDRNALFYLRSRGVAEGEARALLTEAFLLDALPAWAPPDVRAEIEARISVWLRGAP